MVTMRFSLPVAALLMGTLSFGCATTGGSANGQDRVVVAVDPQVQTSSEVVEVTEIVPPVAPEGAAARRRLSQTVTLGQGTTEPIYTPAPQVQGQGAGTPNVTVNNNVTVVQPSYGGYGGFGYGSYGGYGRGGYGGTTAGRDGTRGTPTSRAWAPNGWEGAGRTAAPGRTPGVGGNFSPAPSFGPRSMK